MTRHAQHPHRSIGQRMWTRPLHLFLSHLLHQPLTHHVISQCFARATRIPGAASAAAIVIFNHANRIPFIHVDTTLTMHTNPLRHHLCQHQFNSSRLFDTLAELRQPNPSSGQHHLPRAHLSYILQSPHPRVSHSLVFIWIHLHSHWVPFRWIGVEIPSLQV